jgi:uncharacterized protein YbaP (TraB family)
MRYFFRFGILFAALLAPVAAFAQAAEVPTCQGRDILAELKTRDPDGYAKIRAVADAAPNTQALLWRIERDGRPPSYLFGTIHSTDPRVTKLSPAVTAAFESADTVALEIVYTSPDTMAVLTKEITARGVYQGGNGLNDILSPAELATLRTALASSGVPGEVAHMFRPWFAGLSLAFPPCERARTAAGLDALDPKLEKDALARGKRVVGLETLAGQIAALANIDDRVQVALLKSTIATIELQADQFEVLHRQYLGRDLAATVPFAKYLVAQRGFDPAVLDDFANEIATKRNFVMRDAALPLLEAGKVFIAVGALHLFGKDGLVELIRRAGYRVTAVE